MKKVYIRGAIGSGWTQFMRRPWYLLGLTIATFALFALTGSQGAVVTALSYIIYGGYLAIFLKHVAGETIVFDDLFEIADKRWIYFAFLGLIKNLLIMLGLLCFIVPGIYLAIRWMFADLLVIDKGMRPLEALKASSELTAGIRGKLFLYAIVVGLLIFVSTFALIIGAIVAVIVVQFASIKIYKDLQAASAESGSEGEHHNHDEHHHEPHHG